MTTATQWVSYNYLYIGLATDIDIQQMSPERDFVAVVKVFPPRMTTEQVDPLVEMFPNQSEHSDLLGL